MLNNDLSFIILSSIKNPPIPIKKNLIYKALTINN